MEDRDLHKLRNITPPPPRDGVKKHAINAACQAFEAAGKEKIQENVKIFQGFKNIARLIHSFNQELWRVVMKKQLIAGTILTSGLAIAITTSIWTELNRGITSDVTTDFSYRENEIALVTPPALPRLDKEEDYKRVAPQTNEILSDEVALGRPSKRVDKNFAPTPTIIATKKQVRSKVNTFGGMVATESMKSMPIPSSLSLRDQAMPQAQYKGRDKFTKMAVNPVNKASEEPVSTFSVDVDTASYAFVRKSLNNGHLPQKHAVRLEEMINYFNYDYPLPESAEQPFKPTVAVYPTPWNKHTKLLHIGIKGHDIVPTEKPKSNLVFLLDVSGSMNNQDKLPLLKNAFRLMVENLQAEDTVSIVTYAGRAGTVLEPTKVSERSKILNALDNLNSGGSTAGARGIKQAYALAEENFDKNGVNRIILATDGDFNVGITNREELKGFIERKRESGIFLSVLGFGRGNYNDALMQTLAQNGNGNAAYIDTLNEARKVLVDEASSTLFPIAKDVKIQIEFNPKTVAEYRLIGYETRMLKREDFNNDKVDAGDIGSGHTVTAIYEITPVGSENQLIDDLRYQQKEEKEVFPADATEYAFLKLRYKLPAENRSKLIEMPIDKTLEKESISSTSTDIRFAASVAAFGQLLRGDSYIGDFSYDDVINLAKDARGDDAFGYRSEFLNLVRLAKSARGM